MKGYWRKPDATAEMFVDGPDGRWMRTGDIAYVDSEGRFFIVDRMKELIKVKGNQVAPAELEGVLLEHPQIQDACIVGVTIDGEEVPRAYIVPSEGENVRGEEVARWISKRVAKHKRLAGGVVIVDEVPKNPVSKAAERQFIFLLTMSTVWEDFEEDLERTGKGRSRGQGPSASQVVECVDRRFNIPIFSFL